MGRREGNKARGRGRGGGGGGGANTGALTESLYQFLVLVEFLESLHVHTREPVSPGLIAVGGVS